MGMKRAVLYARVSRDDRGNDNRSLTGQLDMCREYAQAKGWQVVAELSEDEKGASGASWDLPQLNEAFEMARMGGFEILVCRELDRLARSLAKQLVIEGEFNRFGVELAYVLGDYDDTPEGALMKNIRAVISEYERYKITERMMRGRRLKAQAGHVVLHGAPLYGYRYVEKEGNNTLAIDEDEAKIIRMIFDWYTGDENLGTRSIAKRLSDMRIPSPADSGKGRGKGRHKTRPFGTWGASTISGILSNPTYKGVWHYSKYRSEDDPDKVITVPVPALIDDVTWQRAQVQKKKNTIKATCNIKHDYLLRSHLTCGECGAAMTGCYARSKNNLYFYYRCTVGKTMANYARTCEQNRHFRADHVDTLVWGWVKSYLADPAKLEEGLLAYQSEHDRKSGPLRERLALLDKLISESRGQLDRLLDLYLAGDFPKDALLERKTRLAGTIATLQREREDLGDQLTSRFVTEDQVQSIFDFATDVAQGLEMADNDFAARRRIVEILDIRATLAVEEGEKVVYVRCQFWDTGRLSITTTNTRLRHYQKMSIRVQCVLRSSMSLGARLSPIGYPTILFAWRHLCVRYWQWACEVKGYTRCRWD